MKQNKIFKKIAVLTLLLCGLLLFGKKSFAAAGTWQTVYSDEIGKNNFKYYVKYGKLSIARTPKKVYAKKNGKCKTKALKIPVRVYSGLLTNGRDILYQNGKNVYLWSNLKKVKKIAAFSNAQDSLVAYYKNKIYFERYIDCDDYMVYSYDLKTKKTVKMNFYNANSCYGKYLLINGNFHEGVPSSLDLYNIETKKTKKISSIASYGNAGFIQGNMVYYSEFYNVSEKLSVLRDITDQDVDFWNVYSYNIKTGKKTKIYKPIVLSKPIWYDKNHFANYQYDDKKIDMFDIRTAKKVQYKG